MITSGTGEGSFDFPVGPMPGALRILGVEVQVLEPNQTSIMIALCVEGSKLEIRGGSTTPTGVVSVYDHATNAPLGTAEILSVVEMPGYGSSAIARLGPFGSAGGGATAAPVAGQGVDPDSLRLGGAQLPNARTTPTARPRPRAQTG